MSTKRTTPLVSCLTATHGRYRVLREAIACFAQQDYENRELIILNNHPVPLEVKVPKVWVINCPTFPSLGDCRNFLLAEANGEFVRTWDDDDLYLPWAISQGVENIAAAPAFKPLWSWGWKVKRDELYLSGNKYEASWTVRIEMARKYGYLQSSGGNEHNSLEEGLRAEGSIRRVNVKPSYVYRWESGLARISGSLDKTHLELWPERTARWMKQNNDHGDGKPIVELPDLSPYWRRLEHELALHTDEAGQIVL
jgi:glycosyltransferase involved in cell wall biosynthesis